MPVEFIEKSNEYSQNNKLNNQYSLGIEFEQNKMK